MKNRRGTIRITLFLLLAFVPLKSDVHVSLSHQSSCPVIKIRYSCSKPCCDAMRNFAANITGGYVDRKPTYKWSLSSGKITKGQGTDSIDVDAACGAGKSITVTVEIGNVIPDGCPSSVSYTTECEEQ
jgi:PKD domain-containing protein